MTVIQTKRSPEQVMDAIHKGIENGAISILNHIKDDIWCDMQAETYYGEMAVWYYNNEHAPKWKGELINAVKAMFAVKVANGYSMTVDVDYASNIEHGEPVIKSKEELEEWIEDKGIRMQFEEDGTAEVYKQAHPFVRPAVERVWPYALDLIRNEIAGMSGSGL